MKVVRVTANIGAAVSDIQMLWRQASAICRIGVFCPSVEEIWSENGFAPQRSGGNGGNAGFLRKAA